MNETPEPVTPTGIKLHKKSRLLEISFSDDSCFMYPCEYLRVSTPAVAGEQTEPSEAVPDLRLARAAPSGLLQGGRGAPLGGGPIRIRPPISWAR